MDYKHKYIKYKTKYINMKGMGYQLFPYISFPKHEIPAYKKRLDEGQEIHTHRIYNEYGKYELGYIYSHPDLGALKVVSKTDLIDITYSPLYKYFKTWTKKQQEELLKYGYMNTELIKLIKFSESDIKKLNIYKEDLEENKNRQNILDNIDNSLDMILEPPKVTLYCVKIKKNGYIQMDDGCKIYYEEEGEGTPIILLNSGPGNAHNSYHPYFSRLKNNRVIYYDTRGCGLSCVDKTEKTYTIKQTIKDIENIRKHLEIKKWYVLGWSFGGLIAQIYALKHPETLLGLILVAPLTGLWNKKFRRRNGQQYMTKKEVKYVQKIQNKMEELGWPKFIYNLYMGGDWKRQNFYKPDKEDIVRDSYYEINRQYQRKLSIDSYNYDMEGKFDNFKIPTLITIGWYDIGLGGPEIIYAMKHNHPNAKVVTFYRSSHNIFDSEPNKFFDILSRFIKNIK